MGVKVRERGVLSRPVPSPEHTPYPNEDCSGRDEMRDGGGKKGEWKIHTNENGVRLITSNPLVFLVGHVGFEPTTS